MTKIQKFGKLISADREFDYELKVRKIDLNGGVDLNLQNFKVSTLK
jgi:hypothetical protein